VWTSAGNTFRTTHDNDDKPYTCMLMISL
jgi:hypothetical protein